MSLIARMQKNDKAALDELFAKHGDAFSRLISSLGVDAPLEMQRKIVWESSILYRPGPSDLAFALAKLAEGLTDEVPGATTSPRLVAGLAARNALGLADDAEKRAFSSLKEEAIAKRVEEAIRAAQS